MKRSELEVAIATIILKNKNKDSVYLAEIIVDMLNEMEIGPYRTHHGIRHAMHFEKEDDK